MFEQIIILLGQTAEVGVDVASKLPGWAPIPATIALTLIAALVFWALLKYVRGGAGQVALTITPEIIDAINTFIPDKPGLDAHDTLNLVKHLAKSASGALADIENKEFDDVKDEVAAYVKEASKELGFNVPDSVIEKEAQAAFLVIKKFPQLVKQLKK